MLQLSKQQALTYFNLVQYDKVMAEKYLKSFEGDQSNDRFTFVIHKTIDNSVDELERKPPGSILKKYRNLFETDVVHKPESKNDHGQWIGVEIECVVPENDFYSENECDLYCEDHEAHFHECGCEHDCDDGEECFLNSFSNYMQDQKIKRVSVKRDGSIRAPKGFFGVELTVLFRHDDRSNLKKLCAVLNDLGAKVNKTCGLHVHFDQRGRTARQVKKIANKLGANLTFLARLVPESRRSNTYCQLSVSGFKGTRYHAVNLTAFEKYQTLEVRLHSSTIDFEKINNWIDILNIIMTQDITRDIRPHTLENFCFYYNVPEKLITYMSHRIEKFESAIKVNQYASRPAEESDDRQGAA